MNARNILYIHRHTAPAVLSVLDNKLKTKEVLRRHAIPVPETYTVIRSARDLMNFSWDKLPRSFALKPNRGLEGSGIVIAYGENKKPHGTERLSLPFWRVPAAERTWIGANNALLLQEELQNHTFNILDGRFSLARSPDIAYFEERIKLLKEFRAYSAQGIPDIRVIVFNGVPVMAELRIPTQESGGKANLHLGAVGAGIDMGSGVTTYAVHHDTPATHHPDNQRIALRGITIPVWEEILEMAVRAQSAAGSAFVGVDISIDKERGPVVLELNARPGLAIQIANRTSLRTRLERVEGLEISSPDQGVRIAQSIFAQKTEAHKKRRILGIREPVTFVDARGNTILVIAKIDTGAWRTTLCTTLADRLGVKNIVSYKEVHGTLGTQKRPVVELSFHMGNKAIHTEAFLADRSGMKHDMIIGRRDLKDFLVDPAKGAERP